jgi:hypothetical protein
MNIQIVNSQDKSDSKFCCYLQLHLNLVVANDLNDVYEQKRTTEKKCNYGYF